MRRVWFACAGVLVACGLALPARSTPASATSRATAGAFKGSCVTTVTKKHGKKKKTRMCPLAPRQLNGTDPFATCASSGDGATRNYAGSASSPKLAINGKNAKDMVAVWVQDIWDAGGGKGLVAAHTSDGGKTWHETPLPFTQCGSHALRLQHRLQSQALRPPGAPASDLIDTGNIIWFDTGGPSGMFVVVGDPFTNNADGSASSGIGMSRSTDGGVTWTPIEMLDEVDNSQDDLLADPEASPIRDHVYVTWTLFNFNTDTSTTKLVDCKAPTTGNLPMCQNPVVVPAGGFAKGTVSNVGSGVFPTCPSGGLVATGFDPGHSAIFSEVFCNGTWTPAVDVGPFHAPAFSANGARALFNNKPDIAIDPRSGSLYVSWTDLRGSESDILISKSTDGGQHWSDPQRVDSGGDNVDPILTFGPNGSLVIGSLQLDAAHAAAGNFPATFELDFSKDGMTWTHQTLDPFNAQSFPSLFGGKFLDIGSPFDLQIEPGRPFVFWLDVQGTGLNGQEVTIPSK